MVYNAYSDCTKKFSLLAGLRDLRPTMATNSRECRLPCNCRQDTSRVHKQFRPGGCGEPHYGGSGFHGVTQWPSNRVNEALWEEQKMKNLCNEGHLKQALHILLHLDQEGVVPSVSSYSHLLQACAKQQVLTQAKHVHSHIVKNGLGNDTFLGESTVSMFVKCGSLEDGLKVFRNLSQRTAFSWTVIISAYVQGRQGRRALTSYEQMWKEGVQPNQYTFASVLKACGILKDLEETRRIHSDALRCGYICDAFLGATLIDVYVKCGSSSEAWHVFDTLSHRNLIAWNSMIAGYALDNGAKALQLYAQMQEEKVRPDDRTLVSVLKACGSLANLETVSEGQLVKIVSLQKTRIIHADAVRMGYGLDVYICSSLVHVYSNCGSITEAHRVFDKISEPNVVLWTAMITGYVRQGLDEKALELYDEMRKKGMKPDARTFVSIIKACGRLAAAGGGTDRSGQTVEMDWLQRGKLIHGEVVRAGYESNVFVGSTLVHMYANCGLIGKAHEIFTNMSERSVVLWNTLIAGYVKQEQGEHAEQLYVQMQEEGVKPDSWTFASVLQACAISALAEKEVFIYGQYYKVESLRRGQKIHTDIVSSGYGSDVFVANTLIHMYAGCGSISDARLVFDTLSKPDLCSWNTLLAGYAECEQGDVALQLYAQMQQAGVWPDEATFLAALKACCSAGALQSCTQIHAHILESGFMTTCTVSNALIHAYTRCGSMANARNLFDSLPQRNVVAWTTLIAGYARLGQCEMSLNCFQEMQLSGTKANEVTFTSILSACSHAGMVSEGLQVFESMNPDHSVAPTAGHYAIIIDLLSRAGMFSVVEDLLSAMPIEPDYYMWMSLLGACRNHLNIELGRRAFECAVRLDTKQSAAYVVMANLYAHVHMWEDANEIEERRVHAGAWKKPGQSWIEHDQKLHRFVIGQSSHHLQGQQIFALLTTSSTKPEERHDLFI